MVGDNRTGMNRSGYQTLYYWVRLQGESNLTRLSCITYTAERSAFSPIEHTRSPLSNVPTGVTLPANLQAEDKSPKNQAHFCNEEWQLKEGQMLDTAAEELEKIILPYYVSEEK